LALCKRLADVGFAATNHRDTRRFALTRITPGRTITGAGGRHVTNPQDSYDAPVLDEMRELTGRIRDQRTQALLRSVIDAVALNPQPLPPRAHALLQAVVDALNPQPLPPAPPR
jgi:hypothetical protein